MDYYRLTRRGVMWGCSVHRAPRESECKWCDKQSELFTRADVSAPRPPAEEELPPCGACGLYDDEHCGACWGCPDDHEFGCQHAPELVRV